MASLGSLVVSLALDTAKFSGDVGKAAQQMARLTAEAGKIGAAIGANIGAGLQFLGGLAREATDAADRMGELAEMAGVSTEEISRLGYAAKLSATDQETLAASLSKLSKFAADAAAGGKSANDVFDAMGVSVRKTDGSLKSSTDLLGDIADKFKGYEDGVAKSALATEIFGKSGAKLIPFLNRGRDGIEELGREADALGITLSQNAANAAGEFNDRLDQLNAAKQGLGLQIAQRLLPVLNTLTGTVFGAAKETNGFGKAAEVAATGVKLLVSSGAIIVGVFKTIGEYLGGIGAAAVALFEGRFADANRIAAEVGADLVGNIKNTASTVSSIWTEAGAKVETSAPATGSKLAAPLVLAAEKAKKASQAIKTEAQKIYEQVEKQLGSLQFDVDTQGASDRVKGLIELTRKGASAEQVQRYLDLTAAQESYRASVERTAEAERAREEILKEGAATTEKLRTPLEILTDEYDRLNMLLREGAINQTTYARGVAEAQAAFEGMQPEVKKVADSTEEFAKKARENIQNSLGDGLFQIMNGNFKNIGDSFVSMLQRMVAEALAAKLAEALFGSQGGAGAGGSGGWVGAAINIGASLFGGAAAGRPLSPNRAYTIGERGPETFVPTTAGTVIPNGGSKAQTYNVNVNMVAQPGMDRATALQQGVAVGQGLQRAMARNG